MPVGNGCKKRDGLFLPVVLLLMILAITVWNLPFCVHEEICTYRWFQCATNFPSYSVSPTTLDHKAQAYGKKKVNEFLATFPFPFKKNCIHPPFLPSLQQIPFVFKIRLFFFWFLFSCRRVTHCQIDFITITDLVLLVLQVKTRKYKGKGQHRKTLQASRC